MKLVLQYVFALLCLFVIVASTVQGRTLASRTKRMEAQRSHMGLLHIPHDKDEPSDSDLELALEDAERRLALLERIVLLTQTAQKNL
ncbi:hypothetical protein AKO1_001284 [Acrasis kona]|uniref:Uncharacterized protein n=1 Tax=Acrasis kona TaxID=1008807 RepID=A0AAW2ZD08_9EUKA